MFDDEADNEDSPRKPPQDPAARATEKSDELRIHAQLAAVFEATRKYDAEILPKLDPDLARDVQRTMARLDKSKSPESPILPPASAEDATRLLTLPQTKNLSTNDYHVHRRPGEVMILRFLQGPEVDTFYERLQAHFDAALDGEKEDQRQANQWKQDPQFDAYLKGLDALDIKMADRYLRDPIRKLNLSVLSTQTADEIDILYLADHIMSVDPATLVGPASAPGDTPTEQDRAWFFKLFSLRGIHNNTEHMTFFTYLQKSDDSF